MEPLEAVIPIRFSNSEKREFIRALVAESRVEAGSNTSTVALRVVHGDENEVSNMRQ
jgi:hypothetical protein